MRTHTILVCSWRVGDGYVSDDEEVGEDGETSISLDSDMASHLSNDRSSNRGGQTSLLSGRDGGMGRDNLMLSEGHEHVVSMGIPAHVPFQDVIDLAITFMRRIPPRKLFSIAQRYYSPEQAEPMLKMYPEISFFHPPPSWALARFAKADWVLRKRALDRRGLHSRNSRKDRKVLSDLRNRLNTSTTGEDAAPSKVSFTKSHNEETTFTTLSPMNESDNSNYSPEMMEATARELKWPKAMIAQGFGPGEDEVAKRKRRRRLILIGSAATVALFAIAVGMAMKSQPQSAPQPRLQEASAPPAPKKSTSTTSRSNESHKPFQHKDSSNASSKKGSSIVGSMKTAAKDLFADNSSEGCPADSMPYRAPARENSSVPKAAPVSAVGFPNNNKTAVNESLMRTVIKKMIVNQLKAFVYRIRVLVESIDRNVSDPNFQRRVVDFVKSSSSSLANYTMGLFRSTGQQARDNLGGDSIEDLVLL